MGIRNQNPANFSDLALDLAFAKSVRADMEKEYHIVQSSLRLALDCKFNQHGIFVSYDNPSSPADQAPSLNMSLAAGLSQLMIAENLSLEQLSKLVRGQTSIDPRPNKRVNAGLVDYLYNGYKFRDLLAQMNLSGVDPVFTQFKSTFHQITNLPDQTSMRHLIFLLTARATGPC